MLIMASLPWKQRFCIINKVKVTRKYLTEAAEISLLKAFLATEWTETKFELNDTIGMWEILEHQILTDDYKG